ncbi:MAG: stage 0 sporulation family protein [Clostridia bacterium]|nr:stage 0 sporulation family protein [Clostridia bacterium]
MAKIIGVKFKNTAKIYYFAPSNEKEIYPEKSGVVVETAKGLEYGTVAFGVKEVDEKDLTHPLKPILRRATEKDEAKVKENERKIPEAMDFAEEKIQELKLDMKLIGCEYSFDGKKIVFFFTSDGRVDFRELVKILASKFKLRIELRQIGIRDETKLLGGIAPCGRTCCCASCMSDFGKVSIKMAKNQGLHLNPGKISGLCGRLMCCLEYENDYYAEACKKVPKVGGTVGTPEGNGVVISNDMLKMISKVKITKGDGSEIYKDFPVDMIDFKKNKAVDKDDNDNEDEENDLVSEDIKKILD